MDITTCFNTTTILKTRHDNIFIVLRFLLTNNARYQRSVQEASTLQELMEKEPMERVAY